MEPINLEQLKMTIGLLVFVPFGVLAVVGLMKLAIQLGR